MCAVLTTGLNQFVVCCNRKVKLEKVCRMYVFDLFQLVNQGRKVVFAGDDTWMGLFPDRFSRGYPYPSFDVWDLVNIVQTSLVFKWSLLPGFVI